MKNFDFQIADKSPLHEPLRPADTDDWGVADFEQDDSQDFGDFGPDFMPDFMTEADAYSLEDLLRLVQIGDDSCIDRDQIEFLSDEEALIWGLSYLSETTLGRAMAFDARFEDWALEVDDIEAGTPAINSQLRILIMPRGTPSLRLLSQTPHYRAQFLVNLARGLRMIWQDMNGIRTRNDMPVDDQILLERLRRADQDVMMLRMAWDLRDSDGGTLWRQLIADDMDDLVTLAAGLWAEETTAPDTLDTLASSLLPVFQLWLGSDNLLNQVDARTLDDIDNRLQRGITNVCGTQLLRPSDILALGRLPNNRGSYLAPLSRSILYAEDMRRMPDQMLESHLRQIIEDCGYVFAAPLVFNDLSLQE
ncbi:MAG: hypothetical protein AAB276_04065, partial [Pseudomonadota bacterium]